MPKKTSVSPYDVHPSVTMVQKWVAELSHKTGRSLEEWVKLVRESGPATEKNRRDWLKKEYNLGTNSAGWIAERAKGKNSEDDDPDAYLQAAEQWVENMFSGPKIGLRPLYHELLRLGRKLGDDVRVCPCRTIIPLYRHHVFAQIKPSTRTRIDLGFALGDTKSVGRLLDTGGFAKKDRITHRIPITSLADIDEEVQHWFHIAYDQDR